MLNKGGFLPSDLGSEANINSDIPNSSSNRSIGGGVKIARSSIKLLNAGECVDGKLSINNTLLSYIVLIGCVRHYRQSSNGMEINLEDGTGGVNIRIYQDKVPSFEISTGLWVKIIGKVNNGPNGLVVICQKVEQVVDFNEITFHFLMATKQFGSSANISVKAFSENINEVILHYFETTHDDFNGIEVDSLYKVFPQFSVDSIKSSLNFLLNEGHLYTTIDERHLRSVNKGL